MQATEALSSSVQRALGFIERSRNPDGLWSDFLTLAGESVSWVSGYVGYAVASSGGTAAQPWLLQAGYRLLALQGASGGWGYGPMVPPDADSTAWCVRFLNGLGIQSPESRGLAVTFLLGHQSQVDGGFRTYAAPREVGRFMMLEDGVSFEGWSSSHLCVTGVAVMALSEAKSGLGIAQALGCIRRGQSPDGYWEPYWWSERLYSTVHCMEALSANGSGDDADRVRRGADWIASTQRPDGSWSDSPSSEGSPFSTALALTGLMAAREGHHEVVRRGAEWLLGGQRPDGSWSSGHILRIPHPSMKEPWKQSEWRKDGRAIGAVIRDHRRLFTTATALGALSRVQRSPAGGEEG